MRNRLEEEGIFRNFDLDVGTTVIPAKLFNKQRPEIKFL